jgi:general secretion pathway protein G
MPEHHTMKIRHTHTIRRLRAGFTLLEIVIVLGIIAVLLGGSIALIGNLGEGAKIQRVEGDFNAIGAALKTYKLNAGSYPTTQQGLKALVEKPGATPVPRRWTQLADAVPKDPWGNEYIYRFPGRRNSSEFEIISKGKDGMEGTDDDFSSQDPK